MDDCLWDLNRKGNFSSKSIYRVMVSDCPSVVPHKCIWIQGIPSKVSFSYGLHSWIKFSLWTICKVEDGIWLIGVAFALGTSRWITCLSIVLWQI